MTLGQMLGTIQSVFNSEFGVLGWAFIRGYAAVAALITLAVTGVVLPLKYQVLLAHPQAIG